MQNLHIMGTYGIRAQSLLWLKTLLWGLSWESPSFELSSLPTYQTTGSSVPFSHRCSQLSSLPPAPLLTHSIPHSLPLSLVLNYPASSPVSHGTCFTSLHPQTFHPWAFNQALSPPQFQQETQWRNKQPPAFHPTPASPTGTPQASLAQPWQSQKAACVLKEEFFGWSVQRDLKSLCRLMQTKMFGQLKTDRQALGRYFTARQ